MLHITGDITIMCMKCGNSNLILSSIFDGPKTYSHQRSLGYEIAYYWQHKLNCPHCRASMTIKPTAFEYPSNTLNHDEIKGIGCKILTRPTYMVIDSEVIYGDYCLISTWWDDCEIMGMMANNLVVLNEDFAIEKIAENFIVWSHDHRLFEYNKSHISKKTQINLEIVANFTVDEFTTIHHAFIDSLDKNYDHLRQEVRIKEMIDEPNSVAIINNLIKKYGSQIDTK